jgi:cell division protein FtsL
MEEMIPGQPVQKVEMLQPKQPGKVKTMLIAVLVLVLLAAAGFAVWQTMQLGTLDSKVTSLEATNQDLQTSKTSLQAQLDSLKTANKMSQTTDKDKIIAASDAYVRAPVAAAATKFEYTITKNTGKFALVNVKVPEGGGYQLWLKKVSDNWTVLLGGQDQPSQEDIDKYDIPSDL